MKLLACSVYDSAVGAFMPPFFARSKAEALRFFMDLVSDPNRQVHSHPEDYALFALGTYDDGNGFLEPLAVPEKYITALECRSDKLNGGNL